MAIKFTTPIQVRVVHTHSTTPVTSICCLRDCPSFSSSVAVEASLKINFESENLQVSGIRPSIWQRLAETSLSVIHLLAEKAQVKLSVP